MKENRKSIIVLSIFSLILLFIYINLNSNLFTNIVTSMLNELNICKVDVETIIVSLFTSTFVVIIVSFINYFTIKRKIIADIWRHSNNLYRQYSFLMIDNFQLDGKDKSGLKKYIKELCMDKELSMQIREWEDYYCNNFVPTNNEFKMFFQSSKQHRDIKKVQEDIAKLSIVINILSTEYVNSKEIVSKNNFDKAIKVIAEEDAEKLFNTTGKDLNILRSYLNINKVS